MTMRLIETDSFPFEFLSQVAERESWRKEIHRPIYHVHKWWAKRLGSVFRGILLGTVVTPETDLRAAFYSQHNFRRTVVWDPFMGSGTTIGEAHKLGMTALGRDINPVAERAVRVGLGPISLEALNSAFTRLDATVGNEIRELYLSIDSQGRRAEVLYWFWVMQAPCPECQTRVDLFSSWVIARNAYPARKPEVQLVCPGCGSVFEGRHGDDYASCPNCGRSFEPDNAPARGAKAKCSHCAHTFSIIEALSGERPTYRLFAKLLLRTDGSKEYLAATTDDIARYEQCESELERVERAGALRLPTLDLAPGFNTNQAIRYGFVRWRDFFNARQLLALGRLRGAIESERNTEVREALLTLFSGCSSSTTSSLPTRARAPAR